MGNCFRRSRRIRRHIVLILIGLDNAGKTKTVNNLAGEIDDKVLPTVGFKAVNLIHKDTPVTIFDLGGGPQFRQIWPQYYSEVHGVIFVIDSSDFARLDECKTVLEEVLSHDKISGKPVLVLANKQDKNGALDDIDMVEKLNIEPLVNRYRCPTLVESYSATMDTKSKKPKIDPGLRKGYEWLLNYIIRRYGDINLRIQTDIYAELERRKRISKPVDKVSQTVDIENDISTQTGFANPNYNMDNNLDHSLIVVKPIKKPTSVDTTITIESSDESKPKLSPLFGRASNTTTETVKIELEPRNEFRKLSPIVRKGLNHIDFKHRPQSSPTYNRNLTSKSSKSSVSESGKGNTTIPLGDRSRTWDQTYLKHRVLDDAEILQRELVLTEREHINKNASDVTPAAYNKQSDLTPINIRTTREHINKSALSDITPAAAQGSEGTRPASASQLVRRQLEAPQHRRRLSLRYIQRHKTSPERSTILLYEPSKVQALGKGDCEQASVN